MSDSSDGTTVNAEPTQAPDEVAAKLIEFGANDEIIAKVRALGVDVVGDLATLNEADLVGVGMPVVKARHLLDSVAPVAPAINNAVMSSAAFDGVLPNIQDDAAWLSALKTGGVLKVDQSTVIAAVRAALAKRMGLYEVPAKLTSAMEVFADESEEQVDPTFYALRKQMTRRSYAEVFAAIDGLDGSFVTEKRKDDLLRRLENFLWPSVTSFNLQLKGWQESWVQGANPTMFMMAMLGGGGIALPPGTMAPPDTAGLRDSADAVKDAINKVFAGTGVQIAAALAYEAAEIKKTLEDPRLPAMIGVANREQMLKKLGVAVPATYPRLETNVTRYILGVMNLENQAAGQEELSYLGALLALGTQIEWPQLGSGRRSAGASDLGAAVLRSAPYDASWGGDIPKMPRDAR